MGPVWVITPSGDAVLCVVCRIIDNQGQNHMRNEIVLDDSNGQTHVVYTQGPYGGVCPPVSKYLTDLRDRIVELITQAQARVDLRPVIKVA